MKMPFIDLKRQYQLHKEAFNNAIHAVLNHGQYIHGPEVAEFEHRLQRFANVKHAVACGNGTDALLLALQAMHLQKGDVVFIPSLTFAATAEAVAFCGGILFFVDIDDKTYNLSVRSLKEAVLEARKRSLKAVGIIAVDLFGLAADYTAINEIAKENNLWVMSDCAQGFGCTHNGHIVCSCHDCAIATTSFFPAKPLGCYGDGGAVFTNNDETNALIRSLREHGKGTEKYDNVRIGQNSRLDTIQAAILIEKLKLFPKEIILRNKIAEHYTQAFQSRFQTPIHPKNDTCVWAQYTLKTTDPSDRKRAMETFGNNGIPTVVYYPKPLHLQMAYKHFPYADNMSVCEQISQTVFSLPMSPYLTEEEVDEVYRVSELLM